jgi:hypothetical protein
MEKASRPQRPLQYVIRANFRLGESVSLVKVFRVFRLERIFWVLRVWTQ